MYIFIALIFEELAENWLCNWRKLIKPTLITKPNYFLEILPYNSTNIRNNKFYYEFCLLTFVL